VSESDIVVPGGCSELAERAVDSVESFAIVQRVVETECEVGLLAA
jgi:hypothetical protein